MQATDRLAEVATDTSEVALHRARAAWSLALFSPAGGFDRWQALVESLSEADTRFEPLAQHLRAVSLSRDARWKDALEASRALIAYDSVGSTERPFARAAIYLTRGRWFMEASQPDSAIAAWTWHQNTDLEGVADRGVQAGEVDRTSGRVPAPKPTKSSVGGMSRNRASPMNSTKPDRSSRLRARHDPPVHSRTAGSYDRRRSRSEGAPVAQELGPARLCCAVSQRPTIARASCADVLGRQARN